MNKIISKHNFQLSFYILFHLVYSYQMRDFQFPLELITHNCGM